MSEEYKRFSIRLNENEYTTLQQLQEDMHFTSMVEVLRTLLCETEMFREKLINAYRSPVIAEEFAKLDTCNHQLRKIGVNLNQIAKRYNIMGAVDKEEILLKAVEYLYKVIELNKEYIKNKI